jgi:hypothetical protein
MFTRRGPWYFLKTQVVFSANRVMSARFQAPAAKLRRFASVWDITQHIMAIPCRRFRTTYRSHFSRVDKIPFFFDFFNLEDGTDRMSRNVSKNYHYTLRNVPEERRFRIGEFLFVFWVILRSCVSPCVLCWWIHITQLVFSAAWTIRFTGKFTFLSLWECRKKRPVKWTPLRPRDSFVK